MAHVDQRVDVDVRVPGVAKYRAADTVLLALKDTSTDLDIDRPLDFRTEPNRRAFYRSLIAYRNRLPQVFNIAMADEHGQVVVSTAAWPTPNINVSDRDYFNDARTRLDGGLSTSVPIDNRVNGTRAIVFARRLENPNGNFIGIIYASVNSKYFEDIYGSTQSVHSLIFTLVRQDGTILFRRCVLPSPRKRGEGCCTPGRGVYDQVRAGVSLISPYRKVSFCTRILPISPT